MQDLRQLVRVETVDAVEAIDGADKIEAVVVGGWRVVTAKGEFAPGDRCVFFEVDSCLPLDDPRFAFLGERGARTLTMGEKAGCLVHRLKSIRLRGQLSQGLVLPVDQFPEAFKQNADLAEVLGVVKFEHPLPKGLVGKLKDRFPSHLGQKTDSERVQNLVKAWPILKGESWVALEKLDGTSCSVFRDHYGELLVCSRNFVLEDSPDSFYWQAVRDYGIADRLEPGQGLQFEIYGEGIQGNPLRVAGRHIAVFAELWNSCVLPPLEGRVAWGLPWAPVRPEFDLDRFSSVDELIEAVDGMKSSISPSRLAEGIVFWQVDAKPLGVLSGRPNFKVVSNAFLLKHDG